MTVMTAKSKRTRRGDELSPQSSSLNWHLLAEGE